jgi:hemerythrin
MDGDIVEGEEPQVVENAIENFSNSIMRSLDDEENLLRNSRSSKLGTHLAQHRFLASQVNLLKIAFLAGH